MNVETILTGAITGIITAGITGFFGVLFAFKQFRTQRAFDRQLEWYEKTTEAVMEFLALNETIVFALKKDRPDLLQEAAKNMMAPLKEYARTVNKSLLYCERKMYLRLKEIGARQREITEATGESPLRAGAEVVELYQSNAKLLEQTALELSKPIRKMLGLDKLSLADLEK
jgi:hypothetical protein